MSYWFQADLADDSSLRRRVIACAAREGISAPETWAHEQRWRLSVQPGWVEAFASAKISENPDPGRDEAVISDGMILAAVQVLRESATPTSPAA
ncbi:hypothetical protein ACWGOE_07225 [Leucobacter chromiiresistens]